MAEGPANILDIDAARDRLYVTYMVGGPSELRVFDLSGKSLGTVPTEPVSTVDVGAVLDNGDVLVSVESYVTAKAWYRYSPTGGRWKLRFADSTTSRRSESARAGRE